MDNITDITDLQPHLVVECGNKTHVIPLSLIRDIAHGRQDASKCVTMAIATALLDNIDG